jgi:hypothetical protein
MASALVLALWSLISSGVTGSSPYNNLNGVNLVALQMEVLWLHICHTPFPERGNEASIRVLKMFKSHV